MSLRSVLVLLALLVVPSRGSGAGGAPPWSAQSVTAPDALTAVVEADGTLCVRAHGPAQCLALPPSTLVQGIEPDAGGWIASGRTLVDGTVHLYLLAGGRDGTRLLPALPTRAADHRGGPVLLVEEGTLVGVAWLQGAGQGSYSVWAAAWDGRGWAEPHEVSPAGGWPQLALRGAVLPDGRWLLVWTAYDGADDETVYSVGRGDRWSEPARALADNEVFDALPAVVATAAGAIAAWTRFDGNDYRALVAFFDGRAWSEIGELPGRGVDVLSFTSLGAGTQLLYSSVEPESWHLVTLDPTGRTLDHRETTAALNERPWVLDSGAGASFELVWPGRATPPLPRIRRAPEPTPEGETFRYMAFGDSITQGIGCGNGSLVYPARLAGGAYLNCAVNGCQVVNKGLGGETTNQGATRIEGVLDDEGPWDVVLLMEGTNDVCWSTHSNQFAQNALQQSENKATQRGVDTLHVTIVDLNRRGIFPGTGDFPCPEDLGREDNTDSNGMEVRVRDALANVDPDTGYRWWANTRSTVSDPPEVTSEQTLCNDNNTSVPGPANSCLDTYFADWGHPNCDGYARLADEVRDGVVAKPIPGGVVLTEPIGTIFTSVPVFRWNKESPRDATWYQLQVGPGGSIFDQWRSDTTCSAAAGTCAVSIGVLPDGPYTWQVRARNPHGRSGWVQTSFTVLTPPGPPTAVSPSGSIGDPRPAFQWNRENPIKADSYRLEVRDSQGLLVSDTVWEAAGVCSGAPCTAEPFAAGLLLVDGDYTWRVRGINAAGEGASSSVLAFEVTGTAGIFADGFESGNAARWTSIVE